VPPARSIKEAYANAIFKPGHRAADAGIRHAKRYGGASKAAALHDRGKDRHSR